MISVVTFSHVLLTEKFTDLNTLPEKVLYIFSEVLFTSLCRERVKQRSEAMSW